VSDECKGQELQPVTFTGEIHKNPTLHKACADSMGEIVRFVKEIKANHQQRYD